MKRLAGLVVALVLLVLFGSSGALAQDATPDARGEAPDPAECQIEGRTADELIEIWYEENDEGTPELATPEAEAPLTAVPAPLGEPADAETVTGVTETVREVFACFNAGDFGRATALFSENLVRQFGPSPEESPEDVRGFLEAAEPAPEEARIRLLAVTDVAVMEDGRVGAFVVSVDPTVPPEGAETALVLFVETGDRWVVDEVVEFVPAEDGGEATPTA